MFPRQLPDALPISTDPSVWHDPIVWATLIIAAATVANVLVARRMWRSSQASIKLTRDIFTATHRPYVGVDKTEYQEQIATREHVFHFGIKNTGTAAAANVIFTIRAILGGETHFENTQGPLLLHPTKETRFTSRLKDNKNAYARIINGEPLTLELDINYQGPGDKEYFYSGSRSYERPNPIRIVRENAD
jgi:hypothetical protein